MGAGRCSVGARREAEEGLPRELAGDDGEAHDLADVVGGGDLHVDGGVDGEMALFERGGELQLAVLGGGEGTLGERQPWPWQTSATRDPRGRPPTVSWVAKANVLLNAH